MTLKDVPASLSGEKAMRRADYSETFSLISARIMENIPNAPRDSEDWKDFSFAVTELENQMELLFDVLHRNIDEDTILSEKVKEELIQESERERTRLLEKIAHKVQQCEYLLKMKGFRVEADYADALFQSQFLLEVGGVRVITTPDAYVLLAVACTPIPENRPGKPSKTPAMLRLEGFRIAEMKARAELAAEKGGTYVTDRQTAVTKTSVEIRDGEEHAYSLEEYSRTLQTSVHALMKKRATCRAVGRPPTGGVVRRARKSNREIRFQNWTGLRDGRIALKKSFLFVTCILLLIFAQSSFSRTWTDAKGNQIEAEFVGPAEGDNSKVLLKNRKGKTLQISVSRLSKSDQEYVRTLPGMDAPQGKTSRVVVTGYGETIELAKKDALRSAVEKVVGSLVDSQAKLENDELIEKILTASNSYVSSYEVQNVKKSDDFFEVKISATVERAMLTQKLPASASSGPAASAASAAPADSSAVPSSFKARGQELYGEGLNTALGMLKQNEKDCLVFLENYLKSWDFPYSLIDVEILGEPSKTFDKDTVRLTYNIRAKVNRERYDVFVTGLTKILDKICIRKNERNVPYSKYQYTETISGVFTKRSDILGGTRECPENTTVIAVAVTTSLWYTYEMPPNYRFVMAPYGLIAPVVELQLLDKNNSKNVGKFFGCGMKEGLVLNLCFSNNNGRSKISDEQSDIATKVGGSWFMDNPKNAAGFVLLAPCAWGTYDGWYGQVPALPYIKREITITIPAEELEKITHVVPVVISTNKDMEAYRATLPSKFEELYYNP